MDIYALKAAAALGAITAVGHGLKGMQMFSKSEKHFQALPRHASVPYRIGWFQGCALFSIVALLNYRWSISEQTLVDKAIAAVISSTCLLSSYAYSKVNDSAQWVTLAGGILQLYASFIA